MTEDNEIQENDDYGYSTREKKGVLHLDEFIDTLIKFKQWLASENIINPQISFCMHKTDTNCGGKEETYIHQVRDARIGILDPNCDDRIMIDIFEKSSPSEKTEANHEEHQHRI